MRRRDCVWFSCGVSGAIKMLQEALPLSLQWWGITYWKPFLGILPPNENSPLPPPRGRQNTTLVSLKMVHEGEHVRRKWSARVASSSDDLRLPRCHQETSREWKMSRLTPEDNRNGGTGNNNDSQTGAAWCQLDAQRVNTANTNEFDSLLLEPGRQLGFLNHRKIYAHGKFLTGK